ncbi:MAG: GNAT family N-acetyltransferase [Actinobacteria bacterium]|nr:GNAT family N-acetyltransferase [Actinomycetota bacterium]
MAITIEELNEVTGNVVDAFSQLIPQLSGSAKPPDTSAIRALVASPAVTVLIAKSGDQIVGTLTLVTFPIPTGYRAWIEDVVVDGSARGQGVGLLLTEEALKRAREAGARTVDLTTRPSRVAAGNLYERAGFQQRDTRVYRYTFE